MAGAASSLQLTAINPASVARVYVRFLAYLTSFASPAFMNPYFSFFPRCDARNRQLRLPSVCQCGASAINHNSRCQQPFFVNHQHSFPFHQHSPHFLSYLHEIPQPWDASTRFLIPELIETVGQGSAPGRVLVPKNLLPTGDGDSKRNNDKKIDWHRHARQMLKLQSNSPDTAATKLFIKNGEALAAGVKETWNHKLGSYVIWHLTHKCGIMRRGSHLSQWCDVTALFADQNELTIDILKCVHGAVFHADEFPFSLNELEKTVMGIHGMAYLDNGETETGHGFVRRLGTKSFYERFIRPLQRSLAHTNINFRHKMESDELLQRKLQAARDSADTLTLGGASPPPSVATAREPTSASPTGNFSRTAQQVCNGVVTEELSGKAAGSSQATPTARPSKKRPPGGAELEGGPKKKESLRLSKKKSSLLVNSPTPHSR